jgi:hypothetical protein
MLFGIPWPGIVAIVAIVGGLIYAYKEQELKMEEKRMGGARELNEMRKVIHNLRSRVENLEAIAASEKGSSPRQKDNPLGDIEIEDEIEDQNYDNSGRSDRSKTH